MFVTCIHSSIIHHNQMVEVTQVSTLGEWISKKVVSTYNELLFSFKKEGHSDTYYNVDRPGGYYAK